MREKLYWPQTANDVYATVRDYRSLAKNYTNLKRKHQFRLFFPEDPWEYIYSDVLGLFPKTKKGNQLVLVMTDR